MKLTTPIHIPLSKYKIEVNSRIMTIGSCFSEHIGSKLTGSHFECLSNPFNTIFNPISIGRLLSKSVKNLQFTSEEIDNHNDRHFIYDLHSSYDSTDSLKTLENANKSIEIAHDYFSRLDFLIITFGTSIGYHHIEQDRLVSNCHKVPNHQFKRQFLDDKLMFDSVSTAINQLLEKRPDLKIIFTVSPVRHTKEGLVDNNISKSKLVLLCQKLTVHFGQASYFPSYEIMIDELRGYRFYKEDMIHPTQQAVDIIWNRFQDVYFGIPAKEKVKDFQKLIRSLNHRPFDSSSDGHKLFHEKRIEELDKLIQKYPEANFSKYRIYFS